MNVEIVSNMHADVFKGEEYQCLQVTENEM